MQAGAAILHDPGVRAYYDQLRGREHRPQRRPPPGRQPPRRHPPRLPQNPHPLQPAHRLGPPHPNHRRLTPLTPGVSVDLAHPSHRPHPGLPPTAPGQPAAARRCGDWTRSSCQRWDRHRPPGTWDTIWGARTGCAMSEVPTTCPRSRLDDRGQAPLAEGRDLACFGLLTEAGVAGPGYCFGAAGDVEFGEDVGDVVADGLVAEERGGGRSRRWSGRGRPGRGPRVRGR